MRPGTRYDAAPPSAALTQTPHEGPHPRRILGFMSHASRRAGNRADSRIERLEPWIAAFISALLHVLMVLIMLYAAKPTVTSPHGAAQGSRMKVDFIGEARQTEAVPSP